MNIPYISKIEQKNVYKIFVKDLEVMCSIGIYPEEKRTKEKIVINVVLWVKNETGSSDDIDNYLDYEFISTEINNLVKDDHLNLQETLCAKILEICISKNEVLAANVCIEKPSAYKGCKSIGCEMFEIK